jgi:predicted Rossmann fold nucleotide-binding protein DprA/Smf involved in DNA uptake
MSDPFAPLVIALSHAGFSMARPLDRRSRQAWLGRAYASAEEMENALRGSRDPNILQSLEALPAVRAELARLERMGIWAATLFSSSYPDRWTERLAGARPAAFFYVGDLENLGLRALAVFGSRNASPEALAFAAGCGREAAGRGWTALSGGARGVDRTALGAARETGGASIQVVADALLPAHRKLETDSRTLSLTVFHPEAGFSVGQAMGRNKLAYALADVAVVAACEPERGGTWAGAEEALRRDLAPVCVWAGPGAPDGNARLAHLGARPVEAPEELFDPNLGALQAGLFG